MSKLSVALIGLHRWALHALTIQDTELALYTGSKRTKAYQEAKRRRAQLREIVEQVRVIIYGERDDLPRGGINVRTSV